MSAVFFGFKVCRVCLTPNIGDSNLSSITEEKIAFLEKIAGIKVNVIFVYIDNFGPKEIGVL